MIIVFWANSARPRKKQRRVAHRLPKVIEITSHMVSFPISAHNRSSLTSMRVFSFTQLSAFSGSTNRPEILSSQRLIGIVSRASCSWALFSPLPSCLFTAGHGLSVGIRPVGHGSQQLSLQSYVSTSTGACGP